MNLKRWIVLGSLAFFLSGFMALPYARGAVESDHGKNARPVTIAVEDSLVAGHTGFANLPLVREMDPAQELDRIALYHSREAHCHGLVVAMRLGNRLHMLPEAVQASKGLQPRWAADLDVSGRRMAEASGVFDEDEKVIDEPEEWGEDEVQETIADPLEPLNRAFFQFNDKLYFWVLKPVARGYRFVVPEPLRIGVRNVFTNLAMPIRAANCLLQGKFNGFGREVLRFFVNSTAGLLGVADVATSGMHIEEQDEDFGQTLGFFGTGPGLFINWPLFGPSSARDTVGMVGDWFADPLNYLIKGRWENIGVKGGDRVNRTSLSLGDYESLKKSALDPYVAVRDAYFQYRKNKIKK